MRGWEQAGIKDPLLAPAMLNLEQRSADLALGQVLIVALFTLPAALQQRRAGSARNLDASGVAASLNCRRVNAVDDWRPV